MRKGLIPLLGGVARSAGVVRFSLTFQPRYYASASKYPSTTPKIGVLRDWVMLIFQ